MVAGNYNFGGIAQVEDQDRVNEVRTGAPALGFGLALLLSAPSKLTAGVHVQNVGELGVQVRLRHAGSTKTRTNERLSALAVGGNRYLGKLQFGKIVPGTLSVTNGGAPLTVVDTGGVGILYDTGTTTQRGTINYTTGMIDLQYGAAPTEPVQATYQHQDYTDFASANQTTTKAAAAYPFTIQSGIGRVVPGSVSLTEGTPLTFVDDGKGNIIETTGGTSVKRGTIDYRTGVVTLTAGSGALAGTVTMTYQFNPFGAGLVGGGAAKLLDLFGNAIPELTAEPWADGVAGESRVGLVGEAFEAGPSGGFLVSQWVHFGEEPYRVEEEFSAFPPGGVAALGLTNG